MLLYTLNWSRFKLNNKIGLMAPATFTFTALSAATRQKRDQPLCLSTGNYWDARVL